MDFMKDVLTKSLQKESIEQEIHNRNSLCVKTIFPKEEAAWLFEKTRYRVDISLYIWSYILIIIEHPGGSREQGGDPKLSVKRLLSGSTSALLKMSPIWDGQFHWHRANAQAICGLKVTFNWRIPRVNKEGDISPPVRVQNTKLTTDLKCQDGIIWAL